ncbi:hypothetical protein [Desulfobulbus alkaliphilus]|uniref:hypothetical protein n=1 Tax=Desulfobulbus alkaliphilus TaxID=869814 RepID=UPI001965398F|nr:hypothetical protein [Desulfobulbus alkaliphilus]MBM9538722.1 hypothetical protein [Desulfobulbus alkaliphilus]
MQFWDYLLTGAALAIAVWYLYRRIVASRGCSCGCSASSCAHIQQKPEIPKGPDADGCSNCGGNRDQH